MFFSRIYSPSKHEDSFTLLELLIVVIIIGILAAIALPIFLSQQKSTYDASVQSDVRNTVASVATWQTNSANQNKAEANAGAYVAAGGSITVSNYNTVGVSTAADGSYTVCGYTSRGTNYNGASSAYTYTNTGSNAGKFITGSCTAGSDTGGQSSVADVPQFTPVSYWTGSTNPFNGGSVSGGAFTLSSPSIGSASASAYPAGAGAYLPKGTYHVSFNFSVSQYTEYVTGTIGSFNFSTPNNTGVGGSYSNNFTVNNTTTPNSIVLGYQGYAGGCSNSPCTSATFTNFSLTKIG